MSDDIKPTIGQFDDAEEGVEEKIIEGQFEDAEEPNTAEFCKQNGGERVQVAGGARDER